MLSTAFTVTPLGHINRFTVRLRWLVILLTVCVAGCSQRTVEEIDAERRDLPALYLTEKSNKQVRAPATAGLFVDEATGEICYRAYECTLDDCPGRSADGEPYLFIHRDVLLSIDANGEIAREQIPPGQDPLTYIHSKGGQDFPTCPKCLEARDLKSENAEEKQKYQMAPGPYELPDVASRREALEEQYQAAFKAREEKRQGGGS